MKVDLDDLERSALSGAWIAPPGSEADERDIVVALIARIRELEIAVGDLSTEIGMDEEPARPPSRRWNELNEAAVVPRYSSRPCQ